MSRALRYVLLSLVCATTPAIAWNNQGHMATGAIAYDELAQHDRKALAEIVQLMAAHPDHARFTQNLRGLSGTARDRLMFEYMARWPDDIRKTGYDRPEWHYAGKVVYGWTLMSFYTAGEAEVQFNRNLAIATDPNAKSADRAIALCWVFHLTGDMHQPLHSGHRMDWHFPKTDRLGTIAYVRRTADAAPQTLHDYWDGSPDFPGTDDFGAYEVARHAETLTPLLPSDTTAHMSPADRFKTWMAESRWLAVKAVYVGPILSATADPSAAPVMPAAESKFAHWLALVRLAQAGQRLGRLFYGLK